MKPEIKAEWVKRLRSGEIEQGQSTLHSLDGKMCCLGVLSAMAAEAGVVKVDLIPNDTVYNYNGHVHYLPHEVKQWAGLKDKNPEVRTKYFGVINLGWLNDHGQNFETIADLIEEQL